MHSLCFVSNVELILNVLFMTAGDTFLLFDAEERNCSITYLITSSVITLSLLMYQLNLNSVYSRICLHGPLGLVSLPSFWPISSLDIHSGVWAESSGTNVGFYWVVPCFRVYLVSGHPAYGLHFTSNPSQTI